MACVTQKPVKQGLRPVQIGRDLLSHIFRAHNPRISDNEQDEVGEKDHGYQNRDECTSTMQAYVQGYR